MQTKIGLAVVLAGVLTGAGCSSAKDPQMSAADAANFSGGKGGPPSDAKKKAMADFQENFKKLHPDSGVPGAPPVKS
jgi:hypothetical protein